MTLADLRAADPLLHDLLVEACAGRVALATALVDGICKLGAAQALTAERERVACHIKLGSVAGMGFAVEAIASGATVSEMEARYWQAVAERRETPVLKLVPQTGESK